MYQIIDYLVFNSDKNMLITNVVGDVQFCSKKISTFIGIDSDIFRTLRISDLLGMSMNHVLSNIERKKTPVISFKNLVLKYEDTSKKIKEIQVFPIYDSDNIVSNMIFIII